MIRSNRATLGGGDVVDPHARRHRRMFAPLLERLRVMESGSDRDVILKTLELSEPTEFDALVTRANLAPDAARRELAAMADEDMVVSLGDRPIGAGVFIYSAAGWDDVTTKTESALAAYHAQFPLRKGAPKEELRSRMRMTQQIFNGALPPLLADNVLVEEGALVRLAGHEPRLTDAQRKAADDYVRLLESEPFTPPTDAPIDPEVLALLAGRGPRGARERKRGVRGVRLRRDAAARDRVHERARRNHRGRRARYVRREPQVRPRADGLPGPAARNPPRRGCAGTAVGRLHGPEPGRHRVCKSTAWRTR